MFTAPRPPFPILHLPVRLFPQRDPAELGESGAAPSVPAIMPVMGAPSVAEPWP